MKSLQPLPRIMAEGTNSPTFSGRRAFTLMDLLAVLAVLALFMVLLVPTLARTQLDSRAFQCLNNNRELNRAWREYVADNQERLPYASANGVATYSNTWVTGTLDFDPANRSNWDVSADIMKSPLWPYCGTNAGIWKCPKDSSYVTVNGGPKPRVRSFAMNLYLGGYGGTDGGWGPPMSTYRLYLKLTDMNDPTPSRLFVLLDMREDSIDMGSFYTVMSGFPSNPAAYQFGDLPGAYHDGAAGFSFADGHTELHRWQDRRTAPALGTGVIGDSFVSPNNSDVAWLQDHATRPK